MRQSQIAADMTAMGAKSPTVAGRKRTSEPVSSFQPPMAQSVVVEGFEGLGYAKWGNPGGLVDAYLDIASTVLRSERRPLTPRAILAIAYKAGMSAISFTVRRSTRRLEPA